VAASFDVAAGDVGADAFEASARVQPSVEPRHPAREASGLFWRCR